MPLFFRRRGLGTLVGKRTWGGLVGVSGTPPLMDGGFFGAPSTGVVGPDGGWDAENVGVAPDVEVDMTPKEVIAGGDPQLERAIKIVMDELERNPPPGVPRPAHIPRAK